MRVLATQVLFQSRTRERSGLATQVFFQSWTRSRYSFTLSLVASNFSWVSRVMTAFFTAETLAPQDLQNFKSSAWFVPHCGQNIQLPPALRGIRLLYPPGSGKCYEFADLRKFY